MNKSVFRIGSLVMVFTSVALSMVIAADKPLAKVNPVAIAPKASEPAKPATSVLDFTLNLSDGTPIPLETYRGKVLLLVNVASKCGFTGQYAGLQRIFKKYEEQGFVVLGFPANDFMGQEPGTNEEIVSFCSLNYGVTFPIFAKISVKGRSQHELYRFLTREKTNPGFADAISWNFNKFIIDRKGKVIARFGSMTGPENDKLLATIETALKDVP